LRDELNRRYGSTLQQPVDVAPDDLLGQAARANGRAFEPYRTLATLPLRIYITTNPDTLLEQALTDAGKSPITELCIWHDEIEWQSSADDAYVPSVAQPLVFHLFGLLGTDRSLVLTEDDYSEFAAAVAKERNIFPPAIVRFLADGTRIVAGIGSDGVAFQTLLRTILRPLEYAARRRKRPHIIQLADREGDDPGDTERARSYVEARLRDEDMTVYWGSVEEFFEDLRSHWNSAAQPTPA
jgi:hypothetical protein